MDREITPPRWGLCPTRMAAIPDIGGYRSLSREVCDLDHTAITAGEADESYGLLPALARNREPDGFFRGTEQGARLVVALLLLGGGRGIVDDADASLDMHQPVLHAKAARSTTQVSISPPASK